jgi:hypothetical protein
MVDGWACGTQSPTDLDLVQLSGHVKRGDATSEPFVNEGANCILGGGGGALMPYVDVECEFDGSYWHENHGNSTTLQNGERITLKGTNAYATATCELTIDDVTYTMYGSWMGRLTEKP